MGHSMNNGLLTHMRGAVVDAVCVSIGAVGAPTLVDNGKSGLLTVARTSAGLYTFTIAQPVPARLIVCLPSLTAINGTTAVNTARYVEGSYNATAGTFQVVVTDDEATPIAADPVNGTSLCLVLFFQRLTNL